MQTLKDFKPTPKEVEEILRDVERYYFTYIRSGWLR